MSPASKDVVIVEAQAIASSFEKSTNSYQHLDLRRCKSVPTGLHDGCGSVSSSKEDVVVRELVEFVGQMLHTSDTHKH